MYDMNSQVESRTAKKQGPKKGTTRSIRTNPHANTHTRAIYTAHAWIMYAHTHILCTNIICTRIVLRTQHSARQPPPNTTTTTTITTTATTINRSHAKPGITGGEEEVITWAYTKQVHTHEQLADGSQLVHVLLRLEIKNTPSSRTRLRE